MKPSYIYFILTLLISMFLGCGAAESAGEIEIQYDSDQEELMGLDAIFYKAIQINADNTVENVVKDLGPTCVLDCKQEIRSARKRWGVLAVSKAEDPFYLGWVYFGDCQKTFLYQKGGSEEDCETLFGDLPRCDSWSYQTVKCYYKEGTWEFHERSYLFNDQTGCEAPAFSSYEIVQFDTSDQCQEYQEQFLEDFDLEQNKICQKQGVSCKLSDEFTEI